MNTIWIKTHSMERVPIGLSSNLQSIRGSVIDYIEDRVRGIGGKDYTFRVDFYKSKTSKIPTGYIELKGSGSRHTYVWHYYTRKDGKPTMATVPLYKDGRTKTGV